MKIKKLDVIIIALLIVGSFIPAVIFKYKNQDNFEGNYAIISVKNEEYERVELTGNTEDRDIKVESDLGTNIVQVRGEKIGMLETTCPDGICKYPEFIEKAGEIIVCLPNRVVIEIKNNNPDKDQNDTNTR
ncbi:MAG: NusG domain II-containing protein [Clostridium sp.]|nr:NusG domain II-containing protein [Clostridium sp.]